MTTITFYYSDSARKSYFIENAKHLSLEGEIEIDPTLLSKEDRELIYSVGRINSVRFEYPCTLDQVLDYLRDERRKDEERLKKAVSDASERIRALANESLEEMERKNFLGSHQTASMRIDSALGNISPKHLPEDVKSLLPNIQEKLATAEARNVEKRAIAIKQEEEREAAASAAAAEAKKKASDEKVAWIEKHGSDRLKLSQKHEYQNHRLYVTERAAFEYPGWTLDFDDNLSWKPRVGPSLEALKLLEEYPEAEIVWVEDEEDKENYEAVAMKFLAKYWLVKRPGATITE